MLDLSREYGVICTTLALPYICKREKKFPFNRCLTAYCELPSGIGTLEHWHIGTLQHCNIFIPPLFFSPLFVLISQFYFLDLAISYMHLSSL